VYGYLAESMAFCRKLIEYLGDQALFTFDNKQARRAGFDAVEFASALSGHIRHIHISDYDATHDCLVPGRGNEDFAAMRAALSGDDETACWVIEVYEHVFHDPEDLRLSGNYLRSVLRGAQTI
jgi:sugar phosphate isomerase/epimerase